MSWEIDGITDPVERLAWLHERGRADAQLVIEKGAPGMRETYHVASLQLPHVEESAYAAGYRERMHERTLARKAAGIEVVSPDYRGPMTEKDWWRGHTITSPDGTVIRSPEMTRERERRQLLETSGDDSGSPTRRAPEVG